METITYRFNSFKDIRLGAILTLSKAVRGMNYGKQIVINAFNKFVPKEEYAQNEKDEILEWLLLQNNLKESPEKVLKNKDIKNED